MNTRALVTIPHTVRAVPIPARCMIFTFQTNHYFPFLLLRPQCWLVGVPPIVARAVVY